MISDSGGVSQGQSDTITENTELKSVIVNLKDQIEFWNDELLNCKSEYKQLYSYLNDERINSTSKQHKLANRTIQMHSKNITDSTDRAVSTVISDSSLNNETNNETIQCDNIAFSYDDATSAVSDLPRNTLISRAQTRTNRGIVDINTNVSSQQPFPSLPSNSNNNYTPVSNGGASIC